MKAKDPRPAPPNQATSVCAVRGSRDRRFIEHNSEIQVHNSLLYIFLQE